MSEDFQDESEDGEVWNPSALPAQPRGPTHQFKRFYDLGELKLKAIEGYLIGGMGPKTLATKIQTEWGDFGDVKFETLAKQLQRYRNRMVDPKLGVALEGAASRKGYYERAREISHAVDVVTELQEQYLVQKMRVARGLNLEEGMPAGVLIGSMKHEVRLLKELSQALIDAQLQTGVRSRVPRVITVGHLGLEQSPAELDYLQQVKNASTLKLAVEDVFKMLASPEEEIEEGVYYSDDEPSPT